MPRSLVLGNGTMLATFDESLQMRDLYYPYVGMEDHTTYGHMHRVGFFVEGKGFAWLNDASWRVTPRYRGETLVGDSLAVNDQLGLSVRIEDSVHPVHNVLIRRFFLSTIDGQEKRVRCFFHHDFYIYGDKQKDTAFYEPATNSVIHYREKRYFLVGGETSDPEECIVGRGGGIYDSILRSRKRMSRCGISSFTVGKANYRGLEGTWRDAEDGVLSENAIEQGSVDSTVGIHCLVHPGKETETTMWLCLGKTLDEVVGLHQLLTQETPERFTRNAQNYWKSWVNKIQRDASALPGRIMDLYKRSLLLMRLHTDNHGGILAAADSDIMGFNRDTYTYVWPRDGAFIGMAFDDAGYGEVTRRFFEFCCRVQTPDGYLLHKYNPDGSVGSSWHPWYRDGELQLPIQEDETALVLCAMGRHFAAGQDFEFLQDIYERFVKKAAQFLCDFREEETGLPLPSYDLWEEHRGIFSYTTACTIAGLHAAAQIAQMLGHFKHSERYQSAADEMKQALLFHLFDEQEGRFLKKIKRKNGKTTERDATPDMSLAVIWKLGVLAPDDPRMASTMRQLEERLRVRTDVGGFARYTSDHYQTDRAPSSEIPGNPWIITSLWLAQWHIALAQNTKDLEAVQRTLDWVCDHASQTGILPEQLHPITGSPLSVAPLTWSHAVFVETVLQYLDREKALREKGREERSIGGRRRPDDV